MKRRFNLYGMGISDYIYKSYCDTIFQPSPMFYDKKIVIAQEIEKYCADCRRKING